MVQAEKQKKVFLSLCGQRDYDLLTGKEAMNRLILSVSLISQPLLAILPAHRN